jgi:O-antigen/teichoic acid export membrane protein
VLTAAWPMLTLAVTLPLAYQSDRTLLSNVLNLRDVADYSLVSVLYMPLVSIVTIGGQALWPRFMSVSHRGSAVVGLYRKATVIFTAIGVVLGVALVGLGPLIAGVVAGRPVNDRWPYFWFAVLLVAFAFNISAGMYLMDSRGRAVQALSSVVMLAAKISVSFVLLPALGVSGVIVGTLIAVVIFMIIPARIYAGARLRPRGDL